MTDDEIHNLCGRLRRVAAEALPCDLADLMEAFAIVVAEFAHDWPKADDTTSDQVLDVFHTRAMRYAARLAAH